MFNEDQKRCYISYVLEKSRSKNKDARGKGITTFFERLGSVESEVDKDFALFNFSEMKTALSSLCRHSTRYQKAVLAELKRYLDWCIENSLSLDFENRLIGITPEDIDTTGLDRECMFESEDELNSRLNLTLRDWSLSTVDNRTRTIIHLLYNGILYTDIFTLKKSDFDSGSKTMMCGRNNVELSEMCSNYVERLIEMTDFISENRKYGQARTIVDTGHIIENTVGKRGSLAASLIPVVSNTFTAIKDETDAKLTSNMTDVVLSGMFYRMYESEKETGEASLDEYGAKISSETLDLNDVEMWYCKWKKAFNLDHPN